MNVIKVIMAAEGINQSELGRKSGYSQQNISDMMRRDTSISKVVEVLGVMGYEVIARKGGREYRF